MVYFFLRLRATDVGHHPIYLEEISLSTLHIYYIVILKVFQDLKVLEFWVFWKGATTFRVERLFNFIYILYYNFIKLSNFAAARI